MPLLQVGFTLQNLVDPGLAAGEVEVFVLGEALLEHRCTAASNKGVNVISLQSFMNVTDC